MKINILTNFRILFISIVALLLASSVYASQPLVVKLYSKEKLSSISSNGLEDMEEGVNEKGYITNISDPELLVYFPDSEYSTGQALLIVPGGSYSVNAITHEGYETAKWLNKHGITAIVLKYRMPNGNPQVILEDGNTAMQVIRNKAKEWNINSSNVGVMGFSAGGHFASTLITQYRDERNRPNFALLVYPVINLLYSNAKTDEFLLGTNAAKDEKIRYSTQNKVSNKVPPVYLVLCDDDLAVPSVNSTDFYTALKGQNISAEMHIYPKGGHGWWMRERYEFADETYPQIMRWIKQFK